MATYLSLSLKTDPTDPTHQIFQMQTFVDHILEVSREDVNPCDDAPQRITRRAS